MAFRPEEITKLQTMADEMARLIEDRDNTSNNAAIAYSRIGRICVRALAQSAALHAARSTRDDHVAKFQAARQTRIKKATTTGAPHNPGQSAAQQRP
jgi:hypothetical protein